MLDYRCIKIINFEIKRWKNKYLCAGASNCSIECRKLIKITQWIVDESSDYFIFLHNLDMTLTLCKVEIEVDK